MYDLYDLVIIGAGPAGLAAAIYAGRANIRTLLIDPNDAGGQIRLTSDVSNYPGIINTDGENMSKTMFRQALNFGVEFLKASVTFVDFDLPIKKIYLSVGNAIEAIGVIIATGATPRSAGFIGEKEFYGHGVGYCATCDGEFFKDLDVFVVGAGIAATEEAIYLTRYAKRVIIIAREPEFSCPAAITESVMQNEKIQVHFETEVLAIGGDEVLKYASFINNRTGIKWDYQVSDTDSTFGMFVFVGYMPQSDVFADYLTLDEGGYIKSDDSLMTNVEGVFVAGDIRPKQLRQLVTAVSDGAIASVNVEKYIDLFKKNTGISVNKPAKAAVHSDGSLLEHSMAAQLSPILDKLTEKVNLVAILDEDSSEAMRLLSKRISDFLSEFSSLSELFFVTLLKKGENPQIEEKISAWTYPVIAIFDKDNSFSGISYYGVPENHELTSLAFGIVDVSGIGQAISSNLVKKIKGIKKDIHIQVCVLLTCTMCPDMVALAQLIASKNPRISCEMIDISKFPILREQYKIMSVPFIIINKQKILIGKKKPEQFIAELEKI